MNSLSVFSKQLAEKEEKAIRTFITRLKSMYAGEVLGVVLYGSKARGEATADSDIDLLLIMQSDNWSTRDTVTRIASQVSLDYDLLLSTHVVSLVRWQMMVNTPFTFYQNLFAEGVPLLGPPELFDVLAWSKNELLKETI